MAKLIVENLSFSFGPHKVLDEVSFTVAPGKVTTILGPNGSGKTTLLKLILGLLEPDAGSVRIGEKSLAEFEPHDRAKILAYVPQKHIPAFSFPVLDVVAMGRHPYSSIFATSSSHDLDIALESLERMNIKHLHDRPYTELSGGEQQLVLIARALAQQASILVLDEPVSGLDYGNQLLLLKQLRNLADSGITCINTSHFPEHALWISDIAIFVKRGRIIADGPAQEIINSENLQNLYQKRINIVETGFNGHRLKTCVPDFSNDN